MKLMTLLKKSFFSGCLAVSVLITGCSMTLDSENVNNEIRDITGLLNRSAIQKMTYMGGSMLYSPEDVSNNQLAKDVKVAVRIGKVLKNDLGDGAIVYTNSKNECSYGYLSINEISGEKITFTYYQLPEDRNYDDAVEKGIFTIKAGESKDLNGDGTDDICYQKPDAGRKGQKKNMWLKFLADMEMGDTATMFSVIPMQYARSVYPGGLMGINPNGAYIINKYDIGTSNRALISSISYGDFVFDTETNTIGRYVGSGISGKGFRALEDSELEVEQEISDETTVEDILFKGYEFVEEFNVNELLAAMPDSIVRDNFAGRTASENIEYLNVLIQQGTFLEALLAANTGSVVDEIKGQLAEQPVSGQLEQVIINRHSLALLYPEKCPDVNLSVSTLAGALPWLHVDMGQMIENTGSSEASRANISDEMKKKEEQQIAERMAKYRAEAEKAHENERGTYRDDFIEYEIKRDVLIKRFDELTSFNVAPFLAGLTGVQALQDIAEGTDCTVALGIGGYISFANGDPSIKIKLAVLLKFELQEKLKASIKGTSLFTKVNPESISPEDSMKKYKEMYPNSSATEKDMKEFFTQYNEDNYKKSWGVDNWYFNWTRSSEKVTKNGIVHPSDNAKALHKSIQPVSALPLVITFDAQFDIFVKMKLVAEFKDCYAGGIALYGVDCSAGLNWGFRSWFTIFGRRIAPKVWTFYADTYAYAIPTTESAGYAGFKKIETDAQFGGGLQFVFCPVLEFRVGAGIGSSCAGIDADCTIGVWANVFTPIGLYVGFNYSLKGDKLLVIEPTMDLGVGWGVDLQLYLDPPLISSKRWTFPLYSDQAVDAQVFKLRWENTKLVTKEGFKLR